MDGLTGLPNRHKLEEYSKYVWEYALRNSMELSAIMIDIDCFKLYNDNYGHQHGDVCLKRVAEKLGEGIRRKVDLACRFGGEEFVCLLPNTGIAAAEKKAEDLRQAILSLEIPHPYSKADRYLTISLGVATMVSTPDKSIDLLISEADKALYRSKEEGRNRVTSRMF
jgi:diguanylate cyclase (GGDEF)-like protein